MSFREKLRHFFFPPAGSPRWKIILPIIILAIVVVIAIGWRNLWMGV